MLDRTQTVIVLADQGLFEQVVTRVLRVIEIYQSSLARKF